MADRTFEAGCFYPLAFYVTKRMRGDWLTYPDAALAVLAWTLPKQRLVVNFGAGRVRPRRSS